MTPPGPTALAIILMAAGYLAAICCTPPNPSLERKKTHMHHVHVDRIAAFSGSFPYIFRGVLIFLVAYQAFLILLQEYAPDRTVHLCPQPGLVNPALLSWSKTTILALLLIFVGGPIRLSAYGGLGRDFTFNLAPPDRLVTGGIYRWIQHPSYIGQNGVLIGCMLLVMRWDATPACWIGESTLAQMEGWGPTIWILLLTLSFFLLVARVRDEESMLREKFGGQWEDWHCKTKRFIPGVF